MTRSVCLRALLGVLLTGSLAWAQSTEAVQGRREGNSALRRILQKPSVGTKSSSFSAMNVEATIKQNALVHVFKFATADFPGASFTQTTGIANGLAVGNFSFGANTPSIPFTFKAGVYKIMLVPGSRAASVFSVNSAGQIVGDFTDFSNVRHGFVNTAGVFTTVDFPGSVDTIVFDINTAGDMAGAWDEQLTTTGIPLGKEHGFIVQGGNFTSIDFPGADLTEATGINSNGDVVGFWEDPTRTHGFLLKGGVFTQLDAPLATSTTAFGIDDAGEISGTFQDAAGTSHGFLLSNGTFNTVDVPGAAATSITHLPNKGPFAVNYTDQTGEGHGATGN